jgi:hypothetical protein
MIPKEKAEELVNKMERPMDGVSIFRLAAKQLALIAVDEIIGNDTIYLYLHQIDFWKEVKQEIEKL